ncbi:hypothetical protein GCM10028803_21520 [Larkinella knui]|uniref:T9SS C-terminal target domain-containing protein n=1 Tax=Larkinella knui TaxID=2025310 RepID=A0A3P1CVA5_9BACT|nr:T9SS type A sorting domain-containing protein [Larkinella knui]RRB17235.1 T9SS C-terminal target domain-containing protein [Larkinella knui]
MKVINLLLFGLFGLFSVPVVAQKMVPHSVRYQTDTVDHAQLRLLTQVTQPNTTFLRLYFAGTQLGEGSYLVLEGADGSRQELRKQDLENWRYSSAYFNGQSVNVSLFAATGDRNTVTVSGLKVSSVPFNQTKNARQAAFSQQATKQSTVTTSAASSVTYPHAKAVGRFTNGSESDGTGWIAPNGAIVATWSQQLRYIEGFDVIEFNVPPSIGTTVRHPSPLDQYPVQMKNPCQSLDLYFKNVPTSYLFYTGWLIFEPLPNGTGLRPGERQQEYFRIATNPSNYTIDAMGDVPVDLFHYGNDNNDLLQGNNTYRTLHVSQTHLLPQNSYLTTGQGDRDRFVLYNMPYWGGSDYGAPITFAGTNVAIGVHNNGNDLNLGSGRGFRDDSFRNELNDFFASNSVYVDPDGLSDPGTGEIHKPFRTANKAANDAPAGAQVYFARGDYYGPTTFTRPMTLRAPVGTVRMGLPFSSARKAAGPTIPPHWLEDGSSPSFDRGSAEEHQVRAYPNPFRDQTEINFPFAEGGPVSVRILTTAGVPITTLPTNNAVLGQTGVYWNGTDQTGVPVPAGLYLVQVNDGNRVLTTKVLKK